MGDNGSRIKHVFVVEMWRENHADASALWRGMVKHVAHEQQQRYFADLRDLADFIALRLQAPPADGDEQM